MDTNAKDTSRESLDAHELRELCIETLLASTEERVYFKDRKGRRILASAGSLAALASGGSPDAAMGKTSRDLFGEEFADSSDVDDEYIMTTGMTIACKVRSVTIPGRPEMWFQTTKMPLFNRAGEIVGMYGITRDLTAQIKAERELEHQALHDALTGLPNRALIFDRIDRMLERSRRDHLRCAVMFIDLDNFKDVNDTLGHHKGDQLLIAVGDRLSGAVRTGDTVGRLGGDEFVVLVEGESMSAGAEVVADRILDVMRPPFEIATGSNPITISASIGVAEADQQTSSELLREADIALYQAKAMGKHCVSIFAPTMRSAVRERRRLLADLEGALEAGQFFLLYQPTVNLDTNEFTGVEAQLQWRHPERGVVEPEDFMHALESSGLIIRVGAWVLKEACRQGAIWLSQNREITISVSVPSRQLTSDRIVENVAEALQESGFDPALLILELTETTLMRDVDKTVARLGKLRNLGIRIAVNDFGTGYSSLAYLRKFPIDILKIDRSFISGISNSTESLALVRTLVQLGRTLNLETIGDGIESDQQRQVLHAESVDAGQGFLFSKPVDAASIDELLRSRNTIGT